MNSLSGTTAALEAVKSKIQEIPQISQALQLETPIYPELTDDVLQLKTDVLNLQNTVSTLETTVNQVQNNLTAVTDTLALFQSNQTNKDAEQDAEMINLEIQDQEIQAELQFLNALGTIWKLRFTGIVEAGETKYLQFNDNMLPAVASSMPLPLSPYAYTCTHMSTEIGSKVALSSTDIFLDSTTTGSVVNVGASDLFELYDSGGPDDNYNGDELYTITFNLQNVPGVKLRFNDFDFEHSSSFLWDRLGLQVSNDGVTYQNINVEWFHQTVTQPPPWDAIITGDRNGWIVPEDEKEAKKLGMPEDKIVVIQNTPFIKFTFKSDLFTQKDGWHISISSSDNEFTDDGTVIGPSETIEGTVTVNTLTQTAQNVLESGLTNFTTLSNTSAESSGGYVYPSIQVTNNSSNASYQCKADLYFKRL
jgi:hypothetical protein